MRSRSPTARARTCECVCVCVCVCVWATMPHALHTFLVKEPDYAREYMFMCVSVYMCVYVTMLHVIYTFVAAQHTYIHSYMHAFIQRATVQSARLTACKNEHTHTYTCIRIHALQYTNIYTCLCKLLESTIRQDFTHTNKHIRAKTTNEKLTHTRIHS